MLKASREKHQLTHKGKHIRIISDLLAQTIKARKEWNNIIQALKQKNCHQEYFTGVHIKETRELSHSFQHLRMH
jgi:hypothetical protein